MTRRLLLFHIDRRQPYETPCPRCAAAPGQSCTLPKEELMTTHLDDPWATAPEHSPVDARVLSCQGLTHCDQDTENGPWNFHGHPVDNYDTEIQRRGPQHVYTCDLIGHLDQAATAIYDGLNKCIYCGEKLGTACDENGDGYMVHDWNGREECFNRSPDPQRLINRGTQVLVAEDSEDHPPAEVFSSEHVGSALLSSTHAFISEGVTQ